MMGRSHGVSGVLVAEIAVLPLVPARDTWLPFLTAWAPVIPWPPALLFVALVGGGALLPDLDHPSSTAARSLGFITRWLAKLIDHLSLELYYATAGPRDVADRKSGHRLITHTPVGAVTFGVIVTVAVLAHPIAGAVALGAVCALLGLGLRQVGWACLLMGAGLAWWVTSSYPGLWWLWGTAVALGAQIHREGDWCTNSGVPRRSYPLMVNGRRWDLHHASFAFPAGGDEETSYVFPLMCVGTVLALLLTIGAGPLLVDLVFAVGHAIRAAAGKGT